MEPNIRIGLDTILSERNKSRYWLAKATNTRYQIIDNYYKNRVTRYDRDLLLKICAVLGCGIGELIVVSIPKGDSQKKDKETVKQ